MIAQEVSRRTLYFFFFKIILASQNLTPFRHIYHAKPNGQVYISLRFITSSIWNAGSQTHLTKDTAADYLIKSNTILILSYPFLLRQFIYKTIFALSNSIFQKFRIGSVGFCLALNSLNLCLLKKLLSENRAVTCRAATLSNTEQSRLYPRNTSTFTQLIFTALNPHLIRTKFPGLRSITENYRGTEVSRF